MTDQDWEIPHFSCEATIDAHMPVRGPDGKVVKRPLTFYPASAFMIFRLAHLSDALAAIVDALTTKAPAEVRRAAIAELIRGLLGRPQEVARLILDAMLPPDQKRQITGEEADMFLRKTPGVAIAVLFSMVARVNVEGMSPFAAGLPAEAATVIAEAGEELLKASSGA